VWLAPARLACIDIISDPATTLLGLPTNLVVDGLMVAAIKSADESENPEVGLGGGVW
jgi:hypothetical protein